MVVLQEQRHVDRCGSALRRRAGAWLTLASILALFLGQPFHPSAPPWPAKSALEASSGLVIGREPPSRPAAHDPHLCAMCRATAQTRLALRFACIGTPADPRACLTLQPLAPAAAISAPAPEEIRPRAPPIELLVLSA
jgi:hypothetical protein